MNVYIEQMWRTVSDYIVSHQIVPYLNWRSPSTPAHVPVTNLLFYISEPRRYSLLSVFVDCVSSIYAHIRLNILDLLLMH